MTLLPVNATALERDIDASLSGIEHIDVPLASLWNPYTCPAVALPWLAWAYSVDVWNGAWPEQRQRDAIAETIAVHRLKGTVGAVRRAIAAVWAEPVITEWWAYAGTPHSFRVEIDVDSVLDADTWDFIVGSAVRAKPVRSHLESITARSTTASSLYIGGAATSGEHTTIRPPAIDALNWQLPMVSAAAVHIIDTITLTEQGT
jgi:phage tail P2-like protein